MLFAPKEMYARVVYDLNTAVMKRGLLLLLMVLGTTPLFAFKANASHPLHLGYFFQDPFIFVEDGITFAVYPDGEFDFYIDRRVDVGFHSRNVSITFNSGFDYNPFVQYDHYGAVIQVENIPIFYDPYGRVEQIGRVEIYYRNGWVNRIGGLTIHYRNGVYSHTVGYVNFYNRRYVFRPWHRYFLRPAPRFCTVWATPYRMHYHPVRFTFYRPYIDNRRTIVYNVGTQRRYAPIGYRETIYRNDNRVAQVRSSRSERYARSGRSNLSYNDNNRTAATTRSGSTVRSGQAGTRSSSSGVKSGRSSTTDRSTRTNRDSGRSSTTQRSVGTNTRSSQRSTVDRSDSRRSSTSGVKSSSDSRARRSGDSGRSSVSKRSSSKGSGGSVRSSGSNSRSSKASRTSSSRSSRSSSGSSRSSSSGRSNR